MLFFPSEYQLDTQDCGPACLKIISKYYGKYYSLQYLRDICGLSREGVSFEALSYGAEKIGFRTLGVTATIDDLYKRIQFPCILHWNDNHFIVAYKVRKGRVYVSDPAQGLCSYTLQEFVDGWYKKDAGSGVLLLAEPSPDFRAQGDRIRRRKSVEKMLKYFLPYKQGFGVLFAVMLIVTLLQGMLPFLSKAVIDVGIHTSDINFINLLLIANITIILGVTLSNAVRNWLLVHITSRVNIALISDYLIKLMRLPVSFFENKMIGDILQRAQDHERIRDFIMNNSLNLIFSALTFVVFSVILLVYNQVIFYIFITVAVLYVAWVLGFMNIRKRLDWEYFGLVSQNQSYWVETVGAIQDIKINNYERLRRWRWENIQARLYRLNVRVLNITNTQQLGGQFILSVQNLSVTFFCAKAVIQGEITFGVMIATQFIIGMLSAPLMQFINFIISGQYAKISFMRLNEIHELADEEDLAMTAATPLPSNGGLSLSNVYFRYAPHADFVLKQIQLRIPEGKITAFVGGSGSGKSTLLKLLLRLYQPSAGAVMLGDINITNVSLKEWREHCGVVMQDGAIFNDTITGNVVLDDGEVDYKRLEEALAAANILAEVKQMPQGFETRIGEEGRGLSGGQRQRILIARALYKNPRYLFLDEATNALDTINEAKIVQALNKAFCQRTVVVIAHRLSTVRHAHQIVVLRNGYITEVGNHDNLMEKKGYYYQLVCSQMNLPAEPGGESEGKEPEKIRQVQVVGGGGCSGCGGKH